MTNIIPLALLATITLVAANSRGIGIPCDVNQRVGSTDVNTKSDLPMWWTQKAKFSAGNRYTLRAGDGPGPDPTTYKPNEWTELYLRTNVKDMQFTGLVMYAENSAGQKVGQWSIPPKAPFHIPEGGSCVVHRNADPKNYLNRFRFSAPKGTGPVTIKALVKYGLANPVKNGHFEWPNTAHLRLGESQPEARFWFEGDVGENCNQVCQKVGMTCDLTTLKANGQSPQRLLQMVERATTCTAPVMAGCSSSSPAISDDGCFYHDDSCVPEPPEPVDEFCGNPQCHENGSGCHMPGTCCHHNGKLVCVKQATPYCVTNGPHQSDPNAWEDGVCEKPEETEPPKLTQEITCESVIDWSKDGQLTRRICACTGSDGLNVPPPVTTDTGAKGSNTGGGNLGHPGFTEPPTGGPDANGARASTPATGMLRLLVLLVVAGVAVSSSPCGSAGSAFNSKLSSFLLIGLFFIPSTHAHNWLTSPARGNEAGENNGFNGFTSPPCPQKSDRIHTQVGLGQKFPVEWAAGHGFGSFTYLVVLSANNEPNMEAHTLELLDDYLAGAPDKNYMSEHKAHHVSHAGPASHGKLQRNSVKDTFQWVPSMPGSYGNRPSGFRNFGDYEVYAKTPAATSRDERARYRSEKYPWIIAVHKFAMEYDFPEAADVSLVEIPEDEGTGDFIVQYLWSGYYDCVDVRVIKDKSTDVWGTGGGQSGFSRIDHCKWFDEYAGYQKLGQCETITGSTQACEQSCSRDQQCEGIQVLPASLNSIVTAAGVWSGTEHLPAGCTVPTDPNSFVCFKIKQGTPVVGPNYKVSRDPEDPVFYSSCLKKVSGWSFAQTCNTCVSTKIEPGWIFGDKCLSCSDMRRNTNKGIAPKWKFTDDCKHCDNTQG